MKIIILTNPLAHRLEERINEYLKQGYSVAHFGSHPIEQQTTFNYNSRKTEIEYEWFAVMKKVDFGNKDK